MEETVSYKDLKALETRMLDFEGFNKERFEAAERAVVKLAQEAELKAAAANEWRGAMDDINRRLPTKLEFEARLETLVAKQDAVKTRLDLAEGALSGMRMLMAIVTGILSLAVAATVLFTFAKDKPPVFPNIKDVQIGGSAE